jgi:ketosteroid isomerase-like protein
MSLRWVRRFAARVVAALAASLLVLLAATVAGAHDFWLVADAFQVAEGSAIEARGQTSSLLPTSEAEGAMRPEQASDSAAAVATVRRYHEMLAAGDSLGALAMLTEDAVVLESGGVETRAEYRAHHLPVDIEFARAVRSERTVRRVTVRGDVAWVSSTSTAQGEFRGRAVNSVGAELMVLVRRPTEWKISAIHWSSRSRRP